MLVPAAVKEELDDLRAVVGEHPLERNDLVVESGTVTNTSVKSGGPTAGRHGFEAVGRIALLVGHVPDKGQAMRRHCGHYATRTRGRRRRAAEAAATPGHRWRLAGGRPEATGRWRHHRGAGGLLAGSGPRDRRERGERRGGVRARRREERAGANGTPTAGADAARAIGGRRDGARRRLPLVWARCLPPPKGSELLSPRRSPAGGARHGRAATACRIPTA